MNGEQISLKGVSVTLGLPIRGGFPPETTVSLCATVQKCTELGVRCDLAVEKSGIVNVGRDAVLDTFLKGPTDKLFWIDSDMVWDADDFMRLLAISTRVDVVGATYPAKVDGPSTFYVNLDKERKTGPFGIIEAKGFGLGFTIVSREVCEKLAAQSPRVNDTLNGRDMAAVFRVDIFEGKRRTEDMAFFSDIRDLGYTVWLDPSIELGHIGEKQWRGSIMNAFTTEGSTNA